MAGALLAGCAVGPRYQPPSIDAPGQWQGAAARSADLEDAQWWRAFGDPQLDALVQRALEANHDLRMAALRVQQARAIRASTAGGAYPSADLGAGARRQRFSGNGPDPVAFIPGQSLNQHGYRMGLDLAWELDLFGHTRRQVEAADARVEQSAALARGTGLMVSAEVAAAYFELRGLQRRLAITADNIALQRSTVELVERQLGAGLVSEFDLDRARAQLQRTRAQLPELRGQRGALANRLAVLLARTPGEVANSLFSSAPPALPPRRIPAGLPSEVLQRRPDVMAAERALAAATADIGVATAALFPRFSLTAGLGRASSHSDNWLGSASETYGLGVGLDWPVFAGGALRADIQVAEARNSEAALRYEQVVLQALAEVETALLRYSESLNARAELDRASDTSARVVRLARRRYEEGVTGFLDVLDAERELRRAEDQLARAETESLLQLVALYRALGGGWS
nr:efflux transporter outer membrane subunit [Parahaliea mediterranea]